MQPLTSSGDDTDGSDLVDALVPQTVLADESYVIEGVVGRGGFGITYLARDLTLDRAVVVKECFPEMICTRSGPNVVATSREAASQFAKCIEMFMREARSIARLLHPNIVKVHAVFEQNNTAYMVLDFIDGDDLLEIADDPDRSLSAAEIRSIALQVLQALAMVHDHNMLHRDISPDNILLDAQGKPILIDFGSARELASDRARPKTAFLFVKDGYSPFEFYVRGAAHSPASDLYALGGTLYHLITGDPPPDSQLRHAEITSGQPDPYVPLAGRFPGFTPVFLAAVDKALSLRVPDRFQFARDWLTVLAEEVTDNETSAKVSGRSGQSSLSEIVAETNRHVLSADTGAGGDRLVLTGATQAGGRPPVWRDEFNQETQEIAAREAARLEAGADDIDDDYEEPRPVERLSASSGAAHPGLPDPEEKALEDELIALYIERKKKAKKRAHGRSWRAPALLGASVFAIAMASYVAVNFEQMQEDGSWAVLFSSEGLCNSEAVSAISPVRVNCEDRDRPRQLNRDNDSRILRMDDSNQFDLFRQR